MLEDYEEVELIDQVRDRLATLMVSSEYIVSAGVYVKISENDLHHNGRNQHAQ